MSKYGKRNKTRIEGTDTIAGKTGISCSIFVRFNVCTIFFDKKLFLSNEMKHKDIQKYRKKRL